jgi:hypothetical protein
MDPSVELDERVDPGPSVDTEEPPSEQLESVPLTRGVESAVEPQPRPRFEWDCGLRRYFVDLVRVYGWKFLTLLVGIQLLLKGCVYVGVLLFFPSLIPCTTMKIRCGERGILPDYEGVGGGG